MDTPSPPSLLTIRWRDGLNLLLGIWLFISPWILGFSELGQAMVAAFWIFGAVIVVFAILGLATAGIWADWICFIAGILTIILGFTGNLLLAFRIDAIVVGALVTLLAIWAVYARRQVPLDVI